MLGRVSERLPQAREPTVRSSVPDYREFQDGQQIHGTRYRVVRCMGSGGMGTVYEVEHVELGKRFVLKALLRELSRREDLVQRLRNEWRALGRLEHPNIVTVTDAGSTESGVPYFVMERLEGETLAERMRRVRRFSVPDALNITAAILDGISAAHEIGVVHRDIKPPNVILVSGDRPKILDFGVAKIADDPGVVTARGVAVGTPRYMSPEQARGESVDGRADIYSSGLLLFEMIAGVGPFDDARDSNELILAHIARVAPPLSSLAPGVPPEVDAVVASMLQKNLHRRPATARAARDQLRAARAKLNERASVRPRPAALSVQPRSAAPVAANAGGYSSQSPRAGGLRPTLGTKTSFSAPPFSVAPSEFQATAISTFGSSPTELAPTYEPSAPASGHSRIGAVVMPLGNTVHDPMSSAVPSDQSGAPALEPAVVRTEVLTSVPAPAAKETHTQLPRAPERPRSVTPPPIAPNGAPQRHGRRTTSALLGIAVAAVVVGGGVIGIEAARRHARRSAAPVAASSADEAALAAVPSAPAEAVRAERSDVAADAPLVPGGDSAREPAPLAAPSSGKAPRRKRARVPGPGAPEGEASAAQKVAEKPSSEVPVAPPTERAPEPAPAATGARPPAAPKRPADGALPQSGL